jgi:molybdate transport system regulatory protein
MWMGRFDWTMEKERESTPRLRILMGAAVALGPGKADLLDAVEQAGSISAAARNMGMSYRRAWILIEALNRDFKEPLVETSAGGSGGGGARVTAAGQEALRRYRAMEYKASAAVKKEMSDFADLLNNSSE